MWFGKKQWNLAGCLKFWNNLYEVFQDLPKQKMFDFKNLWLTLRPPFRMNNQRSKRKHFDNLLGTSIYARYVTKLWMHIRHLTCFPDWNTDSLISVTLALHRVQGFSYWGPPSHQPKICSFPPRKIPPADFCVITQGKLHFIDVVVAPVPFLFLLLTFYFCKHTSC